MPPSTVKPKPGIHAGVVKSFSPTTNTLKVKIQGGAVIPCVWAAGVISGMIGIKTSYYPPLKTEVIVAWPDKADFGYVLGTVPAKYIDTTKPTRNLGDDKSLKYTNASVFHSNSSIHSRTYLSHKPPVDLVEGEINMENWMGVGLTMLRNLASLQASDLARVECHLLDDMVRIISDTFRHYTAFGDYKISNDGGKLNVIWNGTKLDHEAWGARTETFPKAKMSSKTNVDDSLVDADQNDDGRWRFSQYIGWLGNFINVFVTDPVDQIGRIAEGAFRSGKARVHVNDDGSVLVQSVADIVLEKVVRIPIPQQIRKEDDPAGARSDVKVGKPEFLKSWKPSDQVNIFEMAFQLREYARWLNNSYSLARFHQMTGDWKVPTEDQTPEPKLGCDETDKSEQNDKVSNWRLAYATIRIYRDGSIQTVDAYGNAITTTAVGIQISSPKDILIQAGGSVNIVAGRDINVVARKNVNLTAVSEAIRLCSKTALQGFCSAGNVVLEVASGYWHRLVGKLDVNNKFSVLESGKVSTDSEITASGSILTQANLVASNSITAGGGGVYTGGTLTVNEIRTNVIRANAAYSDTGGHIAGFDLEQRVLPDLPLDLNEAADNFQYQTAYGAEPLYRTMTQQMLQLEGYGVAWSFAETSAEGRGGHWPGTGAVEKATDGGETLNDVSSRTQFTNAPVAMTEQEPKMIVQN